MSHSTIIRSPVITNTIGLPPVACSKAIHLYKPKITVPHEGFKVQSWVGGPIPSHVEQCFQKIWSGGTNFFIKIGPPRPNFMWEKIFHDSVQLHEEIKRSELSTMHSNFLCQPEVSPQFCM